MTQDQVHVPRTRSQLGLPTFDPAREDLYGASIADEVKQELYDALGDSPIGAAINSMLPLVSLLHEQRCDININTHLALWVAVVHREECFWAGSLP